MIIVTFPSCDTGANTFELMLKWKLVSEELFLLFYFSKVIKFTLVNNVFFLNWRN